MERSILQPPWRIRWRLRNTRRPALWGNVDPHRATQRTWEEAQARAWALGTPPRRAPHQEASGWTACRPDPINKAKMPPGRVALTVNDSLQMAGYPPTPLALSTTPENYRAPGWRSATRNEWRGLPPSLSWMIPQGGCRATIPWPRVNLAPLSCYLYGREELLECVQTHEKKLAGLYSGSPVSTPSHRAKDRTPSLSARDRIIPETLPVMTPIQCSSVIFVTLCFRLTRRPDQNRVISICCCPQCGLGPDDPEGDLACRVFRCPQCESPPLAWKGSHPCLGGLLIVWTCAAPSSERFTGAPLAPRLNRPPTVLGTVVSIFPPRVDPPRVTEAKRKSPTRRVSRLRATKSEGGLPVRRLDPLCTAASGDGMIPVGRPLSVIPRAFPSIGGAAVGVRIPLCEHGLARNQSRISGTKGVVPVRKMIQPGTAGATGSKEVVPIRRVVQLCAAGAAGSKEVVPIRGISQSCTTSCTTKWERECEDSISIALPPRSESRCPKQDVVERTRMPLDASGIGTRGDRARCAKGEVHPSLQGFGAWQDFCCCSCSADFTLPWRDCRGLNLSITVTVKQSDRVSPLSYPPIHLFSLHPDLQGTDLVYWKRATLLYPLNPGWETQARASTALRGSGHTSVSIWLSVAATILPRSQHRSSPPSSIPGPEATPPTSPSMGNMNLQAHICALLMGSTITASANHFHRSATLGSLVGFISAVSTDRFTLRNGYGTVEARYHLTAYDCSDPSEVQAYSSIPASHCSTRATPVKKDRPTRFQLLQKERKRYINAYVCSLFRTDIRYNCGVHGHPELDPMHWSFLIPQRVTVEQCLEWLRTRTY